MFCWGMRRQLAVGCRAAADTALSAPLSLHRL